MSTPYDTDAAEALALEEHRYRIGGKSASGSERERIGKQLGRQEGYRQCQADYAQLLEAANAVASATYAAGTCHWCGCDFRNPLHHHLTSCPVSLLRAAIAAVEGRKA